MPNAISLVSSDACHTKKSLHTGVQVVMYIVFEKRELTMSNVPSRSVTMDRSGAGAGAGACEGTQSQSNQIAGLQGP